MHLGPSLLRYATVLKQCIYLFPRCSLQAVICDQATTNIKALHLLGATLDPLGGEDSHCILVGVQRVPVVFDVPHLVKSIRNNFFKHGLKVSTVNTANTFVMICLWNGFMKMNGMIKIHSHTSSYLFTSLDPRQRRSLAPYCELLWAWQAPHSSYGAETHREAHILACIFENAC